MYTYVAQQSSRVHLYVPESANLHESIDVPRHQFRIAVQVAFGLRVLGRGGDRSRKNSHIRIVGKNMQDKSPDETLCTPH